MTERSFQREINGAIAEAIKEDKSRRMSRFDFDNYDIVAPFEDGSKSFIYKINLPESFTIVTYSAKKDNTITPSILMNLDRNKEIYEISSDKKIFDTFKKVCQFIESRNTLKGLSESFKLTRIK